MHEFSHCFNYIRTEYVGFSMVDGDRADKVLLPCSTDSETGLAAGKLNAIGSRLYRVVCKDKDRVGMREGTRA